MIDGPRRRSVRANGIDVHFLEMGRGPLVVLCHGFPELSYSWRHQLLALAGAGYRAVAPDQRGYGDTTRPEEIDAYDIVHLTDDMLGLLDALGEEQAVFVGHDWGAPVVWYLALRAPERMRGVVGMSVPFLPHPERPPVEMWRSQFADAWFYILYFQEPGVADEDLARDPTTTVRRLLCSFSGDASDEALASTSGPDDGRGWVERLPEPVGLPVWLTQPDVDHYSDVFAGTGFSGGLNWYRNMDRNWHLTSAYADAKVTVPALFVVGARDPVLTMMPLEPMEDAIEDLRGLHVLPGTGHWVQQERPVQVNAALVEFLGGLP